MDTIWPDVVIYYLDLFMAGHHAPYLLRLRQLGTRLIAYLPVDGRIESLQLLSPFLHVDEVVFFTETHGVDGSRFHPGLRSPVDEDRLAPVLRLQGSFLVLNGNRTLPRERLDLTLEAFALFGASVKAHDASLVLPLVEPGGELCARAAELGVRDRLVTGISHGEHASAGGAQIVPASSHLMEIWGDAALFAEAAACGAHFGLHGLALDIVSPASAAEARVAEPQLEWTAIAARWTELIRVV